MNVFWSVSLVAAAAVVGTWAYMSGPVEAKSSSSAPNVSAPAPRAPNAVRLKERSLDRWNAIQRSDWISAYDFLTGEQKRAVTLAQFLVGKQNHTYANSAVEKVIASTAHDGYLVVRTVWTPIHPELKKVKLEPGQSLTEEIHMVEAWRWEVDDWYYVRAEREDEFYQAHPDLAGR